MRFVSVAISALVILTVTTATAETNGIFTCKFGDQFYSELECSLEDFNGDSSHSVRTLTVHLPGQRYLTAITLPRIRAPRLVIHAQHLKGIEENAFQGFEDSVLLLKIAKGKIEELPIALKRLRNVRTLNLAGNNIHYLDNSIQEMSSLRQLVLSDNRIAAVSKHAFHYNLSTVNLMNNRIRSLNGSLAFRRSLRWLFVSRNRISSLSGEMHGLESLQLLDVSWNDINDVAWASLDLPLLQILDLSHNQISVLGNGLHGLPQLRTLDLSHNRIEVLDGDNFIELRHLQVLNLSENHLQLVSEITFDCLTELTTLDISCNQIKDLSALISQDTWNDVVFSSLSGLTEESSKKSCDFRTGNPLHQLNLTGNNWKCNSLFVESILRLQKKKTKVTGNPC